MEVKRVPWGDRNLELRRQIFERSYYFCKLHEISLLDYVCILMDECNQSGIYDFGATKEYIEFIKTKKENEE